MLPCIAAPNDAPCSNVHFLLSDRNLEPQGYPWAKMGENILSRCTEALDRLTVRTNLFVDDSDIMLASTHMDRFVS